MIEERDLLHLRRCVDLARAALEAGDEPFGSVLVGGDGLVLFEDQNRVSGGDNTQHPEFAIARWAAANMTQTERAVATVYTSGEHCPMCAAAHAWVGLGRIVYASSAAQLNGWLQEWGVPPGVVRPLPINEVAPDVPVDGPVAELAAEVRELQRRLHQHGSAQPGNDGASAGLIERARLLALAKHGGRWIPDEVMTPMVEHISQVVSLVEEQGGTGEMIAAAWLHDVVEDTDVTWEQIRKWFGGVVADLVDGLTDPDEFEALPLKQRKALQAERIHGLSDDVKRVKLCDQLSNVRRILARPPADWSEAEQATYVLGAHLIALECRGLWPELDDRFEAEMDAASKRYGFSLT